jgi:hypothetical protein
MVMLLMHVQGIVFWDVMLFSWPRVYQTTICSIQRTVVCVVIAVRAYNVTYHMYISLDM